MRHLRETVLVDLLGAVNRGPLEKGSAAPSALTFDHPRASI